MVERKTLSLLREQAAQSLVKQLDSHNIGFRILGFRILGFRVLGFRV